MLSWFRVAGLAVSLAMGIAYGGSSALAAQFISITINKISQKMTVRVDGETEYIWPISTGAAGYETPSGKFRPFRMERDHFSREWDDAPMPHSIFFTPRGHAIHGSYHVKSLGRRASHGCVRLAPANAAKLFALVDKAGMQNTTVVVKGGLFDGSALADLDVDVPDFDRINRDITRKTRQFGRKLKKKKALLFDW